MCNIMCDMMFNTMFNKRLKKIDLSLSFSFFFSVLFSSSIYINQIWAEPPSEKGTDQSAHSSSSSLSSKTEIPRLDRTWVHSFFQKGPQPFIASIRVYPKRKAGRFIGYEIKQILPHSPLYQGLIQVGDVILKINHEPIGKPQEVMRVWEIVQQASFIEVDLLRYGKSMTLKWKIE